ncbi:unnamed protein product [Pedinophyceae sp. YPF-701]|nr:unnamed protein product [Pedinophyceae sp. YPF-701]
MMVSAMSRARCCTSPTRATSSDPSSYWQRGSFSHNGPVHVRAIRRTVRRRCLLQGDKRGGSRRPCVALSPCRDVQDVEMHGEGESEPYLSPTSSKRMGMTVTFRDVSYTVMVKRSPKTILNHVSGTLIPGGMVALMGPSGCGKTTLLDVLAGRKTTGDIRGQIRFDGRKPTLATLQMHTGYVEQHDHLLSVLTVEEMLMYQAELKTKLSVPREKKVAAVQDMLSILNLKGAAGTKIGSALSRGISGGQAKRVNIGIALITEPRVLFLDEPTSGLDSFMADEVVQCVRRLASSGVTVCSTIHCPSAFAFGLFDRLLLLNQGRVIYDGPGGQTAISYVRGVPAKLPKQMATETDVEWMIRVTTGNAPETRETDFAGLWEGSKESRAVAEALNARMAAPENEKSARVTRFSSAQSIVQRARENLRLKKEQNKPGTVVPTRKAMLAMWRYRGLNNYRTKNYVAPRFAPKVVMAIIVLTLFLNVGRDDLTQEKVINIVAVMFMCNVLQAFSSMAIAPVLVQERPLFYRERSDGCYTTLTYCMYKVTEEMLIGVVAALPFSLLVFYPLGLSGSVVLFWLTLSGVHHCATGFSLMVASVSRSLEVATSVVPGVYVIFMLMCGFMIAVDDIPPYYSWIPRINFVAYSWGGMMKNQFQDNDVLLFGPNRDKTALQFYQVDGDWYPSAWACCAVVWSIGTILAMIGTLSMTRNISDR